MIAQINPKYNIKRGYGLVRKNNIARPSKFGERVDYIAKENSNGRKYITVMELKNTKFSLFVNYNVPTPRSNTTHE